MLYLRPLLHLGLLLGLCAPLVTASAQTGPARQGSAAAASPAADSQMGSPLTEVPAADKIALVVGVTYKKDIQLKYTGKDAHAFAEILRTRLGFTDENVVEMTDEVQNPDNWPTAGNLDSAFHQVLERIMPGRTTVVVFFSGHGVHFENEDWLAPRDVNMAGIRKTCVSSTDFLRQLKEKSPARALVFFDACRNEARKKDLVLVTHFGDTVRRVEVPRTGTMYSCMAGELSWESDQYQHGLFTHHLLKALGGDEAASDEAGNLTFDSASGYVTPKVKQDAKRFFDAVQTPVGFLGSAGAGLVLLRAVRSKGVDVQRLIEDAQRLLRNKSYPEAVAKAREALGRQSANADAHFILGTIFYKQGQYDDAIRELQEALRLNSDLLYAPETLQAAINKRGEAGKSGASSLRERLSPQGWPLARVLQALLGSSTIVAPPVQPARYRPSGVAPVLFAAAPAETEPMRTLKGAAGEAGRLLRDGRLKEAEERAREIVQADPQNADALAVLGRALFKQKQYDAAISSFRELLRVSPDYPLAQEYLSGALAAKRLAEAQALLSEATQLHIDGDFAAAEAKAKEALQRDPKSARAYLLLGSIYLADHRPDAAIAACQQALELDPTLQQAREQLRRAQREKQVAAAAVLTSEAADLLPRDPARAAERAESALALYPDDSRSYLVLGQAYQRLKRLDAAIRAYQEALRFQPGLQPALAGLKETLAAKGGAGSVDQLADEAARLLGAGQADEAERRAREAVARDRSSARAWLALGAVRSRQGDDRQREGDAVRKRGEAPQALAAYGQAARAFEDAAYSFRQAQALQASPVAADGAAAASRGRGKAYASMFVWEAYDLLIRDEVLDALVKARAALVEDAENADALAIVGYAQMMLGRGPGAGRPGVIPPPAGEQRYSPDARVNIARALQLDPESALAHTALGTSFFHDRKYDRARQELLRALELQPDMVLALNNLGTTCGQLNRSDAAQYFQRAAELNAAYPYAYANLGTLYFNQGKYRDAEAAYRQAVQREPRNGAFYALLAYSLAFQKNRKEEARAAAGEAIQRGVTRHPAYDKLGIRTS